MIFLAIHGSENMFYSLHVFKEDIILEIDLIDSENKMKYVEASSLFSYDLGVISDKITGDDARKYILSEFNKIIGFNVIAHKDVDFQAETSSITLASDGI